LILNERTFGIRVCIVAFFVSWTTSPSWGVRGNGSGVGVHTEEYHDAIHRIAWEFGELRRGIEDVLLFNG